MEADNTSGLQSARYAKKRTLVDISYYEELLGSTNFLIFTTVGPRYNAPRYNADLAITRFFIPKVFLPHLFSKGKFLARLANILL